ncbi:MAG: cache domain-containing protein [Polyangia bacterium]
MRAKIIIPNLLAVLIMGLASFFYLRFDLTDRASEKMSQRLELTATLFDRSEVYRGFEMLNSVQQMAMSDDVAEAFSKVDVEPAEGEDEEQLEERIRDAWFRKSVRAVSLCDSLWEEREGNSPELVFLTDRRGVVLARNTSPRACPVGHNVSEAIPAVSSALEGESRYIVWSIDQSPFAKKDGTICSLMNTGLLELVAAPVWVNDEVAGTLVIGFEVSNGSAAQKSKEIGFDLAVLTEGRKVYSSSFTNDALRENLDETLKEHGEKIDAAIDSGKDSDLFPIEVAEEPFFAVVTPVENAQKSDRIANVILGSINEASAHKSALYWLLALTGIAALAVIVIGALLGGAFMRPVVAIEEGLLKVINGEFSYRFDVKSSEVGGLSYRINQLIGVLTGEEEEGEDES